jgi:hypothetical protein
VWSADPLSDCRRVRAANVMVRITGAQQQRSDDQQNRHGSMAGTGEINAIPVR